MIKTAYFSKVKLSLISAIAIFCALTPTITANAKHRRYIRHYHIVRQLPKQSRRRHKQRYHKIMPKRVFKKRRIIHRNRTKVQKSRYAGMAIGSLHNHSQIKKIRRRSVSYSVGVRDSNYRKMLQKKYLFNQTPYRYLKNHPYSYSEQSRFVKFIYHELRHHGIDDMHSRAIITSIAAEQGRYIKNSSGFYFTFQQYTKKQYVSFCKAHKLPLTDPLSGVKCFEAIRPAQFNRFLHIHTFKAAYPYFRLAIEVGINAYPKLNAKWTQQMLSMPL